MILGPVPCQGCRKPVVWRGQVWRDPGRRKGRHVCRYVICGALMPRFLERCARRQGHSGYHRSRYAMDNELQAKRRAA